MKKKYVVTLNFYIQAMMMLIISEQDQFFQISL